MNMKMSWVVITFPLGVFVQNIVGNDYKKTGFDINEKELNVADKSRNWYNSVNKETRLFNARVIRWLARKKNNNK